MDKYHKITTVFNRDPDNNYKTLIEGDFAKPEFEYLADCEWFFTEKVDGRNHRVIWDGENIEHRGKTDKAHMPDHILEPFNEIFGASSFGKKFGDTDVVLYGEAYGHKIQSGSNYKDDGHSFVLFDVNIGGYWLEREDVEDIASHFSIDVVPIIGSGTLYEAVELVRGGYKSNWGNFTAEGIIAKPKTQLFNREGERIITKIKHKDFQQ